MTRQRSNAVTAIGMDHIWCPALDNEMRTAGGRYVDSMNLYAEVLEGGRKQLEKFTPTSKLYIVCHGHSRMPLFKTGGGTWTAQQLVDLLVADGLPKDQREIELLVCHAGESVNTVENADKLLKLHGKAQALKALGKSFASLGEKFKKTQAKGMQPSSFEGKDASKMLLPMAAQLSSSLKNAGYTHFRVISYKAAVAQYCQDGKVYLDLSDKGGAWGVCIDKKPEYRVVWQ